MARGGLSAQSTMESVGANRTLDLRGILELFLRVPWSISNGSSVSEEETYRSLLARQGINRGWRLSFEIEHF